MYRFEVRGNGIVPVWWTLSGQDCVQTWSTYFKYCWGTFWMNWRNKHG